MADELGLGADKSFKKCLLAAHTREDVLALGRLNDDETVSISCRVLKVNENGKQQKRVVAVTNLCIYNFKPGKYKTFQRRMRIERVGSIFVSTDNAEEFIIHFDVADEYDYTFLTDRREQVVGAIQRNYTVLTGNVLSAPELDAAQIEACRKTKKNMTLDRKRTKVVLTQQFSKKFSSKLMMQANQGQLGDGGGEAKDGGGGIGGGGIGGGGVGYGGGVAGRSGSGGGGGGGRGGEAGGAARGSGSGVSARPATGGQLMGAHHGSVAMGLTRSGGSGSGGGGSGSGGPHRGSIEAHGGGGRRRSVTARLRLSVGGGFGVHGGGGFDSEAALAGRHRSHTEVACAALKPPVGTKVMSLEEVVQELKQATIEDKLEAMLGDMSDCETDTERIKSFCAIVYNNICFKTLGSVFEGKRTLGMGLLHTTMEKIESDIYEEQHWALKVFWQLLRLLKQLKHMPDNSVPATGWFCRQVGDAITRKEKFVPRAYEALLELLLGRIILPGEAERKVEAFGKAIKNPEILPLILHGLYFAPMNMLRDCLKDLNLLLVKRDANFLEFVDEDDWASWALPLLNKIPAGDTHTGGAGTGTARSKVEEETFKYLMNFYAMVHLFVFRSQGRQIDKVLRRNLELCEAYTGNWSQQVVAVARTWYLDLLAKVGASIKSWKSQFAAPEWGALFKLTGVIEEFLFYRPVNAMHQRDAAKQRFMLEPDADDVARQSLGGAAAHRGSVGGAGAGPARAVSTAHSDNIGIHCHPITGKCDDVPLVKRLVKVLEKLGLSHEVVDPDNLDPAMYPHRQEREHVQYGAQQHKAFTDTLALFGDLDANRNVEEAMVRVAAFLQQRQKRTMRGFLQSFKGQSSRRLIAKKMQSALKRQRVVQLINAQQQAAAGRQTIKATTLDTDTVGDLPGDTDAGGGGGGRGGGGGGGGGAGSHSRASSQGPRVSTATESDAQSAVAAAKAAAAARLSGRVQKGRTVTSSSLSSDVAGNSPLSGAGRKGSPLAGVDEDAETKEDAAGGGGGGGGGGGSSSLAGGGGGGGGSSNRLAHREDSNYSRASGYSTGDDIVGPGQRGTLSGASIGTRCGGCDMPIIPGALDGGGGMGGAGGMACPPCGPAGAGMGGGGGSGRQFSAEAEQSPVVLHAQGQIWHRRCFVCAECGLPFPKGEFVEAEDGLAYCKKDYCQVFAPDSCGGCLEPLRRGDLIIEACGRRWHQDHFTCSGCDTALGHSDEYFARDDNPYCGDCYVDNFLRCLGCGEVVEEGEADGIFAMNRNWHRKCFSCHVCHSDLPDGVFYVGDTSAGPRPFCENHYIERYVPKCRRCDQHIFEGGVQACGGCWHNEHFHCSHPGCTRGMDEVSVGEDGEPMPMMDRGGLPYCEEHYYETFGDRCEGCGEIVRDEVLNALGSTWHPRCFCCNSCGEAFGEDKFFQNGGLPFCEECYLDQHGERCEGCGEYVLEEGAVKVLDKIWHPQCVTCSTCTKAFGREDKIFKGPDHAETGRTTLVCEDCSATHLAPKCPGCLLSLGKDEQPLKALDKFWHVDCFKCAECNDPLRGKFLAKDGIPYCGDCFGTKFAETCFHCEKAIMPGQQVRTAAGKKYHAECMVCSHCNKPFGQGDRLFVHPETQKLLCQTDYVALCASKCARCKEPLEPGKPIMKALDKKWHPHCFTCVVCTAGFPDGRFCNFQGWPVCPQHATGPLPPGLE